jgi:alpha-glucosidase
VAAQTDAVDATATEPTQPGKGGGEWWRDAVVYEVYLRSFADGGHDGIGDLAGLRSRLEYLRDLGVDAIWITPFYRSPMADHGYDVADPRDVDPLFGDLAQFDAMLAEAHDLGLKVLVDLIPNHSSSEHPAFRAALAAGRGSPERERYLFRDGRGSGGREPPNNWGSVFGGPAWTRVGDPHTDGQWYLHLFAPEQPDWNWRNKDVWAEYDGVIRFWLDRGVDGFRVDVAHGVMKHPDLPDNPPGPALTPTALFRETAEPGAWDQDEVHDVYRHWREVLDEYQRADGRVRVLVGETWVADPQRLANYVRPGEMHLAFSFGLLVSPWSAQAWRGAIAAGLDAMAAVAAPTTWALANHDVIRPVTRYGGGATGTRRARAALVTALALPGAVFLYQGDELALPQVDIAPADRRDPTWERSGHTSVGRDGSRVPMPWSGTEPPYGFCAPEVTPWLPQPADWAPLTAAAQGGGPLSTLVLVRSALAIRAALPALGGGSLRAWDATPTNCVGFERTDPARTSLTVVCLQSMAADELAVQLPGELILASEPVAYDGETLVLPPDTAVWIAARAPAASRTTTTGDG